METELPNCLYGCALDTGVTKRSDPGKASLVG